MASSISARNRRFSRDLLASNGTNLLKNALSSLQVPAAALQPMISLRASGVARLIFQTNPTSFEGVLITAAGEETFAIKGVPAKNCSSEDNDGKCLVDVHISDGETGQLYVIRRVDLLPPPSSTTDTSEKEAKFDGGTNWKTLSARELKSFKTDCEILLEDASAESHAVVHENQEVPFYELRSDALKFSTEEILVGNRADKEIRAFINPALAGQLLNVHIGRMNVEFNAAITPPPTPVYDRARRRGSCQLPLCGGGGDANRDNCTPNGDSDSAISSVPSDADVNFLM